MNGRVESVVAMGGEGPPVVFLHGAGGPAWDGFLDDLAGRFTVYAPSLPGTEGDPDAVREIRGLWELVLHYYEVFDHLSARIARETESLREAIDGDIPAFTALIRETGVPDIRT